jgi:integrase
MPKQAKEMGALEVKRAAHPSEHDNNFWIAVGGVSGLLLQITPGGAKSWILRTVIAGKRRVIGLGPYPEVGLADARNAAREMKGQIMDGRDPVAEREARKAELAAAARRSLTLREAVERFIAIKGKEFSSDKHRAAWGREVDRLVGPSLGELQIDAIDMRDVLAALEPHWHVRTDTAKRVRQRLERIFDWATVAGHRSGENPARWKGALAELLPSPSKVAKAQNWPALAQTDAASWWADLRKRDGNASRALEFAALTWARSGDVRGARWDEIDPGRGLWIIPAERMKAGREHRVPLSAPAIVVLEGLTRPEGTPLIFPAERGGMLSDAALGAAMRRIHDARVRRDVKAGTPEEQAGYRDARSGRPAVPHGLRSTARDWAVERGIDHMMAEIALAHVVGSEVERAYRRSDMLDQRRSMMDAWAAFLDGREVTGENVVALKTGR